MADDRGIALYFDMRAEVAKVRWFLEVEDRRVNRLGDLDYWARRQEVDKAGRCWSEGSCPVLVYDLKVTFD